MSFFYKLFILTIISEFLFINSESVSKAPKRCVVSFSIPLEIIKPAVDGGCNHRVSNSTESPSVSTKRRNNAIDIKLAFNVRRSAECKCVKDIPNKLRSKKVPRILDDSITKPRHFDNTVLPQLKRYERKNINTDKSAEKLHLRKLNRYIRNVMRNELERFLKHHLVWNSLHNNELRMSKFSKIIEESNVRPNHFANVPQHNIDPRKISLSYLKEYLQADSTYDETKQDISDIRMLNKRSHSDFDNYDIIKNREYMTNKFEQIEHDIDTLANGISALHDNMFESKDIKEQFSQEKIKMENSILEKLRSEYKELDIKNVHINNELQTLSDMLQSTMKSQRDLQARIQNFNATFKLKTYTVEMNISEIITRLNALNETLHPSHNDNFPPSDANQSIANDEAIAFVSTIKEIWPTLIKNVTEIRKTEDVLLNKLNQTLERHELNIKNITQHFDIRHSLRQEKNDASFNYFGLFYLQIVVVLIFVKAV